jgi:molybdopterin-containing oxidoreductase family iron-sulfur binding subunit
MTQPKQPRAASGPGGTRRQFLKVLGAAGATTAVAGCASDRVERLIPYVNHPDNTVPGVSNYYATTCRECAAACGIVAETRDGRAIKLEGNPVHPLNRGALCARGQAALQGLYNPDRYRSPMMRASADAPLEPVTWEVALQTLQQRLAAVRQSGDAARALFVNAHESGSFPVLLDQWLASNGMPAHLPYDALMDHAVIAANRQVYGVPWPSLRFQAARLVVSIGADFLDGWGASVPQQLDWAEARAQLQSAPRFVYIGSRRSLTGLNADEWIACRPGSELAIINALSGAATLESAAQAADVPVETLQRLGTELRTAAPSLVLSGVTTADAFEVARAAASLNQSLGNVGRTVLPGEPISGFGGAAAPAEMAAAIDRMREGQVSVLFVRNVNPVFTMPLGLQAADAIRQVPFKVSFNSYPDETSELCDLILPDHHPLESWGDAQVIPNVVSLQQPAMVPVFPTRSTADVLIELGRAAGDAQFTSANYREWLMSRFPGGTQAFIAALESGLTTGSAGAPETARPLLAQSREMPQPLDNQQGEFVLQIYPSPVLGDRGANKPWLQELPDPVTKITWQSWIEIHPLAAERLDVISGDILALQGPAGTAIEAPAYVYPGVRPDTLGVMFGRGHRPATPGGPREIAGYPEGTVLEGYGRFAAGIGVNPLDIAPAAFDAESGAFTWTSTKVGVVKTGAHERLATTEGSARQHGRGIARAMPASALGEAVEHEGLHEFPGDASHEFLPGLKAPLAADAQGAIASGIDEKQKGMYDPDHWSEMASRRWAMVIDLARCTGCSACVTACYAENNVPTVGAPYQSKRIGMDAVPGANVANGREMAWIRLERYYEGDVTTTNFDTRIVPMLCQHCGNAPCEPVCPVYATYHAPDGLNVQVYNRCVGTRYCSNNCPYKVRYFNWFGYGEPARPQYAWPEPLNWQLNPDVTVRGKGVMEKCTFCVQRIREAENRATLEDRELLPDEFTVACAQACPSRAIVFGDAADQNWTVAQRIHDARAYHVFEELNTFTAVVYLQKVNHPGDGQPAIVEEAHGSGH